MSAKGILAADAMWGRPAALVVTAIVLLCAAPAVADGWRVLEQPGRLLYQLPGGSAWSVASQGLALPPGTSLRSGSGRPAVLGEGDDRITIRSGSELTLPDAGTETVLQRLGSILYQIRPGAPRRFAVETPYLALGIKGTAFEVLVSPLGAEVQVSEGRVAAATPDGRSNVVLAPGQAARISSAPGSVLQVQQAPGQAFAPVAELSAQPAGYRTEAGETQPVPEDATRPSMATAAAVAPSIAGPEPEQAAAASTPTRGVLERLRSGVQGLLSKVEIVHDDRLLGHRPRSTLRTVRSVSGRSLTGLVGGVLGGERDSGGGGSDGSTGSASSGGNSSGGGSSGGGGRGSSGGPGGGGSPNNGSSSGGGNSGSGGGSSAGSAGGGSSGGLGGAVGGLTDGLGGAVGGLADGLGGLTDGLGGLTDGLGGLGSGLGL